MGRVGSWIERNPKSRIFTNRIVVISKRNATMVLRNSRTSKYWNIVILVPLLVFGCYSTFCLSFSGVSNNPVEKLVGPRKVAVAGATGRTGRLVVQKLLEKGSVQVVALVRDLNKAKEALPYDNSNISILKCDLSNPEDIKSAVSDCDAAIWCATGFSDQQGASFLRKLQTLFRLSLGPKQSIDLIAIPTLAEIFQNKRVQSSTTISGTPGVALPQIVMMSSAGVTRPKWAADKKKRFPDCADIPIVRLNPFGILDIKAESEEKLRQSGVQYCIFRPCGLNNEWPNGRPILSQGDIAVGRINRDDAAKILVEALHCKEAAQKTFEAFTLKGYDPPRSLDTALKRLKVDSDLAASGEACLSETYSLLQQLLPGEVQEPSRLAMGQTYEQLDNNQDGRLGKRGEEDLEASGLKPS